MDAVQMLKRPRSISMRLMQPSIAIVGVAGLACARRITDAHLDLRLFDKGRSRGGRFATRRVETPRVEARFDRGALNISARDPAFDRLMEDFASAVAAAPWEFEDGIVQSSVSAWPQEQRWVGAPEMSAFARPIAKGLAGEAKA